MHIIDNTHVSITRKGEILHNIGREWGVEKNPAICRKVERVYRIARKRSMGESYKEHLLRTAIEDALKTVTNQKVNDALENDGAITDETVITTTIQHFINFFSEFNFEPNFRFLNTFALKLAESDESGQNYISHYFELTDNPDQTAVIDKMKSREFADICTVFKNIKLSKRINNRLDIYYGSQGTGKTTDALKVSKGAVMVCHSAMLPSDLMEDFKFVDGSPVFSPSILQLAMATGKVITLDEINLLPFESLRFLQSVLDGKTQINYKGKTIEIAEGFKIIGTMNLTVNGATYSLPEPLVDRCFDIKKYSLSASQLLGALK